MPSKLSWRLRWVFHFFLSPHLHVCIQTSSPFSLPPPRPELSPTHTPSQPLEHHPGMFSSSAQLGAVSPGQGAMPEVLEAERPQMDEVELCIPAYLLICVWFGRCFIFLWLLDILFIKTLPSCFTFLLLFHILKALICLPIPHCFQLVTCIC